MRTSCCGIGRGWYCCTAKLKERALNWGLNKWSLTRGAVPFVLTSRWWYKAEVCWSNHGAWLGRIVLHHLQLLTIYLLYKSSLSGCQHTMIITSFDRLLFNWSSNLGVHSCTIRCLWRLNLSSFLRWYCLQANCITRAANSLLHFSPPCYRKKQTHMYHKSINFHKGFIFVVFVVFFANSWKLIPIT